MEQNVDVKKLEMRIVELEDELKTLRAARQPVDISADEVRAYLKVKDVLRVDWGDFCGINDCARCNIARCGTVGPITRCLCAVECFGCGCVVGCGPCACISAGSLRGSLGRFSSLGE